ncbi:hypothetical protein DL98DRAFT_519816 [Cadophora sp. DSE1049]|nr:hypothetical protein DL98DRAFT_519816 [Cadophora sp. DSE1049]
MISFLDVDCERRPVDPQDYLSRMLNFVSLDQESCYYSSISRKGGDPVMEIWYNACEKLSFDIDEQSSIPSARNVMLDRKPVPICFRYSFRTKKSIYILGNTPRATETILRRFCELAQERGEELHPFAFHLVILQDAIRSRDPNMAYNLKSLLLIEDLLLEGSLMTTQSLDKFRQQTQELHEMSRSMIITEHYNDRYLSNLRNLMRDMEGLENEGKRLSEGCEVNYDSHERTKDGLLCLLDYCMDRARRLNNRKQRVQNLIGLLYNLTANRDSMASLKIAEESTNIAHETRKDSMAMKTIATLTMLYLPASFVCSLFGTNFFALDTDGESQRSFVVSGLWWLLVVVAVPVTLVTFGVWLWWMKLQGNGRRKREDLKEKGNRQC